MCVICLEKKLAKCLGKWPCDLVGEVSVFLLVDVQHNTAHLHGSHTIIIDTLKDFCYFVYTFIFLYSFRSTILIHSYCVSEEQFVDTQTDSLCSLCIGVFGLQ